MSTQNDGGPAFPPHPSEHNPAGWGMSLRDYFAAAALQGPLASRGHIVKQDGSPITTPWEYAHAAYSFADAMLAARARRDGEGKGQP